VTRINDKILGAIFFSIVMKNLNTKSGDCIMVIVL